MSKKLTNVKPIIVKQESVSPDKPEESKQLSETASHQSGSEIKETQSQETQSKDDYLVSTHPEQPPSAATEIPSQIEIDSEDEMSGSSARIDRLDKTNYESWRTQIECILIENSLWLDLGGKDAEREDYASIAKRAYCKIIPRCDAEHVNFLKSVAHFDSVKALKALQEKYEGKGAMSTFETLQRCLLMRHQSGPIDNHIDELRRNYQKLNEKGFSLPEMVSICNLMVSLPPSFSNIMTSFIHVKEDDLKFEDVVNAILSEQRRQAMSNYQPLVSASASQLSRTNKWRNQKCDFCNKMGHSAQKCFRNPANKCVKCNRNGHTAEQCRSNNNRAQSIHQQPRASKQNSNYTIEENNNEVQEHSMYTNSHKAFSVAAQTMHPTKSVFHRLSPYDRKYSEANYFYKMKSFANGTKMPQQSNSNESASKKIPVDSLTYAKAIFRIGSEAAAATMVVSGASDISMVKANHQKPIEQPDLSDIELNCDEKEFEELCNKYSELYAYSSSIKKSSSHTSGWIVDSGASLHMSHDKNLFQNLTIRRCGKIKIADGSFIPIEGYGAITIVVKGTLEPISLKLQHVAYVPELHINLISVNELNKSGHSVLFEQSRCSIQIKKEFLRFANFINNNYLIDEAPCYASYPCAHEWHRRLAHRNLRDVKNLREFGLKITKCGCNDQCDACMRGKTSELPFSHSIKPERALDIIVSDICGPLRTQSIGGSRYFLTLTDVFSDYTEVKFLKHKDEATENIINFVEFIKNQTSNKPKIFRSDGGGEFVNSQLQSYLKKEGIRFEMTTPHTPQQNGIAERKNRTLNDAVRTLLIASKLPDTFWAEAMNNVVYTQNRITRKSRKFAPIELFFGKRARATFIEFGKSVYVTTGKQSRGKLDPHATIMKFLSVDDNAKGFRLWNGSKVIVNRNIKPKADTEIGYNDPIRNIPITLDVSDELRIDDSCEDSEKEIPEEKLIDSEPTLRRSSRLKEKNNFITANHTEKTEDEDPNTFQEALKSKDRNEWIKAMTEEMESLKLTGTYELADLPINRKAIGCKWVFKRKQENNNIRYKARLVAKGFSQKYGEDFVEIFAPVARAPTIRLLLSMAGKHKFHVKQFDVKTAFLNGNLEEEIYMKQPEGFKSGDQVFRLRKSLYGLKQAARSWNLLLTECLTKAGFSQSDADDFIHQKTSERSLLHYRSCR